jgi:hypothetical protein
MRSRLGFVSNSSSSSFIIGYGVIKNRKKFNEYVKEHNIDVDHYDVKIREKNESIYNESSYNNYANPKNSVTLQCTNSACIEVPKNITTKGAVVIVEIGNNEGDDAFVVYDENGEYVELDYDRAKFSWFPIHQQDIINLLNDRTIIDQKNMEIKYGAERNG